jgi:hypothetical protein
MGNDMYDIRKILVGKPKQKTPLGATKHNSGNNIKLDLKGMGCKDMDGILRNMTMNLQIQ